MGGRFSEDRNEEMGGRLLYDTSEVIYIAVKMNGTGMGRFRPPGTCQS